MKVVSCRTGPLRGGRSLRDGCTRFASLLPLVDTRFCADQREGCAKRSHTTMGSPPA